MVGDPQPGDSASQAHSADPGHAARQSCKPNNPLERSWLEDKRIARGHLPAPSIPSIKPVERVHVIEVQADLWDRILSGYALPTTLNDRINAEKRWFLKNPDYMRRVSAKAARYLHFIVGQLEGSGLPLELALLPIMESAYDPFAYSRSRAAGIWQFIPATGRRYQMDQNWWYDGRRDPVDATSGAIAYLSDLQQEFKGDWLLALAAYNAGEGRVRKAIRRNRRAGKAENFWQLSLPKETRSYVPRLLALAHLLKARKQNKLPFDFIPDRPYFTVVDLGSQLDLNAASKLSDTDNDELQLLNAGLNRWSTPPNGPHRLLIPVQHAESFRSALSQLQQHERVSVQTYTVRSGDTLSALAQKFGTTVAALQQTNSLRGERIRANQRLLIRGGMTGGGSSANVQRYLRKLAYRVRRGDSLYRIAKRFSIATDDITRWNGIEKHGVLRAGQSLTLYIDTRRSI